MLHPSQYIATGARYAREKYGNKPESNGKNECIVEDVYSKKKFVKKIPASSRVETQIETDP